MRIWRCTLAVGRSSDQILPPEGGSHTIFSRRHIFLVLCVAAMLVLPAAPARAQRSPATTAVAALGDLSRSLEELSSKVSASVVQIFVTGYAPPDDEDPQAAGQPIVERTSG